jgi:hypothetical protein
MSTTEISPFFVSLKWGRIKKRFSVSVCNSGEDKGERSSVSLCYIGEDKNEMYFVSLHYSDKNI